MNKIPVAQTIKESYRFTFGGLGKVIGLIWLPVVILTVGSYFMLIPYYSGMAGSFESGDMSQQGPLLLRVFCFELVAVVLFAMIAVAITREILNPHERPSLVRFSLGPAEFRVVGGYFGLFVLMFVFIVVLALVGAIAGVVANLLLPAAGQAAGAGLPERALGVAVLVGLVGGVVLIYVLVRLSFLLVPAAVAEGKFGIERSWRLTKGNFWRIFAIGLATLLPIMIVCAAADIAILGTDFLNPHLELAQGSAAQTRHMVEQMRQMSAHLPLLMGLGFLLAPFTYGLTFAPAVFAYRALTAPAAQTPQA